MVLCIELKSYTHTNESQLKSYRSAVDSYYKDEVPNENRKFVLLGVWEDIVPETDESLCKLCGFKALTFQAILDEVFLKDEDTFESSGHQLFD
ncbi:MAG: hypothetical protein LBF17_01690 [Mediterranea sp.]|jgi:hypothetical protein|nr:hypothetical protein [Mediterranea sp.]